MSSRKEFCVGDGVSVGSNILNKLSELRASPSQVGERRTYQTMAKVLVVEDDIDLCGTVVDALEAAGHTVYSAYTGTDAVDMLVYRRIVPDVVVLDLQLPGNSGIMILGVIRGLPRMHKTRVIITSGHVDTGQWAVSQWGADLFLQKPVSFDVLKRAIDEFTSRSRTTTAVIDATNTTTAHASGAGLSHAPDGARHAGTAGHPDRHQ